jgi:hypothetical protein
MEQESNVTRDEIIKMAIAAGLLEIVDDAYSERIDWEPYVVRFFSAAYEAGAAAERETCLLIVEYCAKHGLDLSTAADAIRSRGMK